MSFVIMVSFITLSVLMKFGSWFVYYNFICTDEVFVIMVVFYNFICTDKVSCIKDVF